MKYYGVKASGVSADLLDKISAVLEDFVDLRAEMDDSAFDAVFEVLLGNA